MYTSRPYDESDYEQMKDEAEMKDLKERYQMACHNLCCYSKNYTLTEPKEIFTQEWQQAKEKLDRLEKHIIDEYGIETLRNF